MKNKIDKNSKKMYDSKTYAQIRKLNQFLEDYRDDSDFVRCVRDAIERSLPKSRPFDLFDRITASIAAKQFNRIYGQDIHPRSMYFDIRINGVPKRIYIVNDAPEQYSIDGRICYALTVAHKDILLSKMTAEPDLIKVNLPENGRGYEEGIGEGVWVSVDRNTMEAYNSDAFGGIYTGILNNDSCYYPDLQSGCEIEFEMRGQKRAVALYQSIC